MFEDNKLPIDLVRFYAVEMIKALNYLKSKKVLHRDIKPANIMLDHHFHIRFADFGLSIKHEDGNYDCEYNKIYRKLKKFKENYHEEISSYNITHETSSNDGSLSI